MTGKIGKSHPHFQAKHRVSPQCSAGGGITSLGLRFYNVASEKERNLSKYLVSKYSPLFRGTAPLLTVFPNRKSSSRSYVPIIPDRLISQSRCSLQPLSILTHTVVIPSAVYRA